MRTGERAAAGRSGLGVRIRVGNAAEVLRGMADQSAHAVITSPPYWGMRNYHGGEGMIGLEPTFEEHLENLRTVFREVWRVLRDDGTFWCVYGDSHSHDGHGSRDADKWPTQSRNNGSISHPKSAGGFRRKQRMLLPTRLAIALEDDGWLLRQDIIWDKPNAVPESATDRPSNAHETILLMVKSERYFFDVEAVKVPSRSGPSDKRKMREGRDRIGGKHLESDDELMKVSGLTNIGQKRSVGDPDGVRLRSVWRIATEPYHGDHNAVLPTKLVEPCIKASTSEHGVCGNCGTPWRRQTKRLDQGWDGSRYGERVVAASAVSGGTSKSTLGSSNGTRTGKTVTLGWIPGCECDAPVVPATVLDPFGGAGTVGLVAHRLGRSAELVEISPKFAVEAHDRISEDAPLFVEDIILIP